MRTAQICTAMNNAWGGKAKIKDYLLVDPEKAPTRRDDPNRLYRKLVAATVAVGTKPGPKAEA